MLTLKKVNAAIAHLKVELIRGEGYFYLVNADGPLDFGSIYVYRLNHMTLEKWVEAIESVVSNNL